MTPSPRAARPDDLKHLEELERLCFEQPWSADLLARCFGVPHVLVRVIDGHESLAAAAIVQCAGPDEAELLRICCHPDRRREGHARRLLACLLEELARRRLRKLFLEVRSSNQPALALYRNVFGFEDVGVRRAYYSDGTDALVLCREV